MRREALVSTVLEKNNLFSIQSLLYRNWLARIGAYYCFGMEGIFMGVWGRYLPSIQDSVGLSDSLLGTSVLFVYLGTVMVGPFVAFLLQRFGSKFVATLGAWAFISALPILAFPTNFGVLTSAMFYYGFAMGIMDISMNNCAILTEIVAGKPLLGSFHGTYSVAAALGSLLGGLFIQFGLSTLAAFLGTALVAFVLSVLTSMNMYNYEQELKLVAFHDRGAEDSLQKRLLEEDEPFTNYQSEERVTEPRGYSAVPNPIAFNGDYQATARSEGIITNSMLEEELERPTETQYITAEMLFPTQTAAQRRVSKDPMRRISSLSSDTSLPPALTHIQEDSSFSWQGLYEARTIIAFFSAVGFLGAFGESGIVTWSVVFFERHIPSSTVVQSLGLTSFMVCMAVGRFFSDYLRSIFGRRKIIRVGGLLAMSGLAIVVVSPDLPVAAAFACLGFAITGLGLSTIIPIVFSSAGHLPGVHAGTAIAAVATASYSGSIISSPLIGVLSDAFGSLRFAFLVDACLLGLIFPLSWGIIEEAEVFQK